MGEAVVQRGQATRQRLLDAAVPLVGELGWDNVTTRLIAERAGVNPGVVHYHFASVPDLLAAACTSVIGELLGQVAQGLAEHADAASGTDWLLREIAGYPGTDPASLVLAEAFLASSRQPDLRTRIAALLAEFRTRVADWLRGHGCGPEAEATAAVLAAALDGLVLHRTIEPELDITAMAGPLRRMAAPAQHSSAAQVHEEA